MLPGLALNSACSPCFRLSLLSSSDNKPAADGAVPLQDSVCVQGFSSLGSILKSQTAGLCGKSMFSFCCCFVFIFIYLMYVSTLLLSSDAPEEGIGSHYRCQWATMLLLGIELRTSGRAVSAPNHWAISPPMFMFFKTTKLSSKISVLFCTPTAIPCIFIINLVSSCLLLQWVEVLIDMALPL